MKVTCPKCIAGVADGVTCVYCDGDAEIDLTNGRFKELAESDFREITGTVWTEIFAKLDTLQADMDIIKPQIQTCYDDIT